MPWSVPPLLAACHPLRWHRSLSSVAVWVPLQEGYRVSMQPKWEAERSYMLQVRAAGLRVLPAGPVNASIIEAPGGGCAYDAFIVSRRPNYKRSYELLDAVCPGVPQVCTARLD